MPSSLAYQAAWLATNAPSGDQAGGPCILGRHRFKVAGSLYQLQQKLREGNSQAAAQAYVAAAYLRPVIFAAADIGNSTALTDFQAIDSL